ncbi:MAG TPA: hypothetical protein VD758_11980, partial [Gemmatimonadaceae bacterium]|nr:hypothetical protein [Gemmatimonadaceae bacterium]
AGANLGLGSLIWISWEVMRIDVVYASLVMIMLLGISLNVVVRMTSDALAPWLIHRDGQAPRRR